MNSSFLFFALKDGTKVFTASTDKQCKQWDLNTNQAIQVAQVMCGSNADHIHFNPFSLTRNITSHSVKNLAVHSLYSDER